VKYNKIREDGKVGEKGFTFETEEKYKISNEYEKSLDKIPHHYSTNQIDLIF